MSKEKVPLKIVVPIIVVTWVLSLVSSLAIIYSMPSLVPVRLADGSVTSAKILDGSVVAADIANETVITAKIANGSVTTAKMAANAIPFASTCNNTYLISTASTSWVDMPDMSVSITLARTSHVLVMFTSESVLDATGDYLVARAMVDSTQVLGPTALALTSETDWSTLSLIWYAPNLSAGSYTVKIQWRMHFGTTTGHVYTRILSVIALPA